MKLTRADKIRKEFNAMALEQDAAIEAERLAEYNTKVPSKAYPDCNPKYFPVVWQLDPEALTTKRVQYWYLGCMSSVMTLEDAKFSVRNGYSFVINEQAIGALVDGLKRS